MQTFNSNLKCFIGTNISSAEDTVLVFDELFIRC